MAHGHHLVARSVRGRSMDRWDVGGWRGEPIGCRDLALPAPARR